MTGSLIRFTEIKNGLITTVLFIILVISLLIPPLSMITVWLFPLPFFVAAAQRGWGTTVFPAVLCCFFVLLVTGHPFFLMAVLFSAITGAVMGSIYRQKDSTGTDVVLGGLVTTWVCFLLIAAVAHWSGVLAQVEGLAREQWKLTEEMVRSAGMEGSMPDVEALKMVIPGVMMMFTLPFPFLNLVLGRRWLLKKELPGKYLPPFRKWRLPRSFFYFYFIILVAMLFSDNLFPSAPLIFGNASTILYFLFFLQGLSFIAFLLHHFHRGKGWFILTIVMSFLLPFVTVLVHFAGILDTGTELRNRLQNKS